MHGHITKLSNPNMNVKKKYIITGKLVHKSAAEFVILLILSETKLRRKSEKTKRVVLSSRVIGSNYSFVFAPYLTIRCPRRTIRGKSRPLRSTGWGDRPRRPTTDYRAPRGTVPGFSWEGRVRIRFRWRTTGRRRGSGSPARLRWTSQIRAARRILLPFRGRRRTSRRTAKRKGLTNPALHAPHRKI